ncbi:hypothetical protein CFC21_022787 [Triticum aestivum]|uniref:Uncharacterized protein n=2 Tax=Triticum aestivum TaxID=4565 RepID=A0A3B6C3L4_WHEAT|nr:hypothetical protein CFC21_022787 [Triticum aestivum]
MVLPKEMGSLGEYLAILTTTTLPSLEPSRLLAFVDRGGLDAAIALSPEVVAQVASVGAEVDEIGALAANYEVMKPVRSPMFDRDAMLTRIDEAVFVKKLGRLLASLEIACPGSCSVIACLLVDEVSTGKIKKVNKALRSIGKKSVAIDKASAAA